MWEVSERRHVRYVHGLNKDSLTKYFYPTIARSYKTNLVEKFVLRKESQKKCFLFDIECWQTKCVKEFLPVEKNW